MRAASSTVLFHLLGASWTTPTRRSLCAKLKLPQAFTCWFGLHFPAGLPASTLTAGSLYAYSSTAHSPARWTIRTLSSPPPLHSAAADSLRPRPLSAKAVSLFSPAIIWPKFRSSDIFLHTALPPSFFPFSPNSEWRWISLTCFPFICCAAPEAFSPILPAPLWYYGSAAHSFSYSPPTRGLHARFQFAYSSALHIWVKWAPAYSLQW